MAFTQLAEGYSSQHSPLASVTLMSHLPSCLFDGGDHGSADIEGNQVYSLTT